MGIEKKSLKRMPRSINKRIENKMDNTNKNIMDKNVSTNKEKMFKTFKLREWPLKNDAGVEIPKWEKLPSYEWKKDDKKKFHMYKHLWKKRSDELLGLQNCGVPTGLINNIWVLDLDFYVKDGEENGWSAETCLFTKQFGNVDDYIKKHNLYAVKTISGGTHIYFRYDSEMTQTTSKTSHIDIRADGGYVVSPFTKMNGGEYTFINRGDIQEIQPDLKEFVKLHVINKQKKTYKKINKKVKVKNPITDEEEEINHLEVDLDVYEFDFSSHLLDKITKALPDNFFHDREFHVKYATAMKTLGREDVFIKWSKKRCEASEEYEMWPDVEDNDCEAVDNHLNQMWNYIGRHNELFMVNYILKEAEKNGLKNARVMLDYYKYKPVPKNEYEPNANINREKLGYQFFDEYERKYLLCQSDTGTGKTSSFTAYMLNKQKEDGTASAPFISVVSRVSLGKEQVKVFKEAGINNVYFHEEISTSCKENGLCWGYFHGDNIVITIDSLMKMKNFPDFDGYTLYLDEYNSLIEYLICVRLLEKNRLEIFNFLTDIMRQAERVIGTDADINEISIRYMEMMLKNMETDDYKPEYYYIKNEYQHNKGIDAKEIFSFNKFVKNIRDEPKWMICCDSKTQADILSFMEKDSGEYMLITAEGVYRNSTKKWTSETPDLDECDRVIFSPAIVYGLDSTMERPVFCYFKERTISPNAMVQQIARCRKIKYLRYIFTKKSWEPYRYHDFEQVQEEILSQEKYGVSTLSRVCDETGECLDCEDANYTELRAKYEYRADCYETNKFAHFIKILRERGFKVDMRWSQTSTKNEDGEKKKMKNYKKEEFDKGLEEYKNSDDFKNRNANIKANYESHKAEIKQMPSLTNMDKEDISYKKGAYEKKKAKLYDEWGNVEEYFSKSHIQLNDILKVDYDNLDEYKGIFMNPYEVEDHFHICKFFFNDKNGIKKLLDKKNDFICNKTSTIEAQLLLIEKFRSATGCNEGGANVIQDNEVILGITNENDFCSKKNIKVTKGFSKESVTPFLKEYGIVFPRSNMTPPDLTDKYECEKFLVKMYKGVFGTDIIKNKKSTKKQPDGTIKSVTKYDINDDYFSSHLTLFQYRNDYWMRQKVITPNNVCDYGGFMIEDDE